MIKEQLVNNSLVTALSAERSIVFIDSKVDDYQILARGVIPGTEVFILDADQDGVAQISQILSQKPQLSTVHIVSHGSPGCLYLGNTQLSLDTLDKYQEELKTWFFSSSSIPLSPSPSTLLIYGCNVAAGDAGEELIAKLHNITGAEIAASKTLTGNPNKGGNWHLEYKTTEIKTSLPFTEEIQHSYSEILVVTTSGTVFIDYNNDGTQQASNDAEEIAYEGITVIAYDANNNIISQAITDSSGNYSLDTPDNTSLRIEFGNLPSGFVGSSIAGTNSVSDVLFIDGTSNVTANFGIHRPSDVTTGSATDIDLITVCYVEGIGTAGASAIVIHDYNDAGTDPYTALVDVDEIGTVNGLAYHRESSTLFAGSFYKRHSALLGTIEYTNSNGTDTSSFSNDANGAAYTSIIYSIDNAGNVTEFARLDDVVDPRGALNNSTATYWEIDNGVDGTTAKANEIFDSIGKIGLGDVELSEDGRTLWAVNLNDNKLYELPVGDNSNPLTPNAPATSDINSYDIITQIINSGDELGVNPQQNIRPFALAARNGLVYVGMVNTAQYDAAGVEGNLTADDLQAFVYTFDPNNPSAAPIQVLDIPLNYERDHALSNNTSTFISGNWNPWTGTFPSGLTTLFTNNESAYAQPILSDIDFDSDGNMILGFRDRWGDQVGYQVRDPNDTDNYSADTAGDILQAIYDKDNGTWTVETHVTTDGIDGNSDPDGEFFRNEFLEEGAPNDSSATHAETAQGGLTIVPGFTEAVTTALDPIRAFSGGYEWFDTTDGSLSGHTATSDPFFNVFTSGTITASGLEIFLSRNPDNANDVDAGTVAKANGLGDVEFIAAAATLEIGDRIWFDTDQDGIQDVGEGNVPDGVNVELYASGGTTALQTTTTTTNGNYYFAGLDPLTDYEVRLVASDFGTGQPLVGYQSTLQNAGSNDDLDSDAADSGGVPVIFLTTGSSGTNDHSFDIGLTNTPTYDYGDAPDAAASTSTGNYQTTDSDGGAKHILGSGLTIGSGITADDGTLQNVSATADTDDGVTFTETLETGDSSFSVSVDVNLPGTISSANLAGWIDFNQDGAFNANEAVRTTVNSSGATTLTWNSFPGIVDGTTYARFRLSTASALDAIDNDADSIGEFSDGEVEDYQITIGRDYGDAVDTGNSPSTGTGNYQTTSSDSGASHGILNGLSIGSIIDADSGTLQDVDASQDDTDGDDDEDGVTFSTTLSASDTSYSVAVDVTNTTGSDALLSGWIDFNQDGVFDNTTERTSTVFSSSGTQNLIWGSLPGLVEGTTYARFRLSTDFTPAGTSTIYSEDFEGITDWRTDGSLNIGNTASAGDWAIGDPTVNTVGGTTMQPEDANGGTNALISDLSTADIDAGSITSRSDTFTLDSGSGTHSVTFSYFLSSFTSNVTDEFTVDIVNNTNSSDRETIFTDTVGSGATQAAVWTQITQAINTSFNGKTVYLEFTAQDGGGDDTVEAGVDDITVTYTSELVPLDSTGALNDGEVEDYVVNVSERDYGDAPDTTASEATGDYQTTVDNGGASHIIDSNLKIGSLTDADSGTLQNDDANADDTDNSDDEDGVTFNSGLDVNTTSYSTTVTVTNNTGSAATLVGWVDFNQNGVFESAEAVVANVPDGNTDASVTLTWDDNAGNNTSTNDLSGNSDLPGTGALSAETLATGTTYARFRLTTDSNFDGDDALGAADDGEVEDYKLTVNLDYGDARDTGVGTGTSNYNTTAEDNGASHIIVSNANQLTIGDTVDADDGTLQNADADADDSDGTDDETGISSFSTLQTDDDTYSLDVAVTNSTGSTATLVGWIDFDQSGTFDSDEAVINTSVLDGTTTASPINLNWTIPEDITDGITYARFRLSTDGDLTTSFATGQLSDGEVEDYTIDIEGVDYGDAPDAAASTGTGNYQTTQDDSGASHIIVSGLKLGATVDAENGTLQNTAADADDLANNNDDDDEDGISFPNTLSVSDAGGTYTATIDTLTNNTGSGNDARVIGWIDFDQDGVFEASEAAIADSDTGTAGQQDFSPSVFDIDDTSITWDLSGFTSGVDIVSGATYARFRIVSDVSGDLASLTTSASTGAFGSGEVEDYQITIEGGSDYGDASTGSDSYLATTTSHSIAAGLNLGSLVDSETSPTANSNADADDTTGQDDEDGVTFNSVLTSSHTTYSVTVDVVNTTGSDAEVIGWIDFDGNGTFDTDEASEVVTVSASGQITLDWTSIPSGTQVGDTYARFRLNSNPTNLTTSTATGTLDGGEVEDYLISIKNEVSGTGSSEVINTSSSDPTTAGDDFITGSSGQDTITGGGGDDCFHFNRTSDGVDVITDFSSGDRIDLSDFFATGGELAGITNPFGTYVEAVTIGSSGTLIQIDFEPNDSLYNKNLVYLEGYTTTMTAADFIF